jgi:hypothetical protein
MPSLRRIDLQASLPADADVVELEYRLASRDMPVFLFRSADDVVPTQLTGPGGIIEVQRREPQTLYVLRGEPADDRLTLQARRFLLADENRWVTLAEED